MDVHRGHGPVATTGSAGIPAGEFAGKHPGHAGTDAGAPSPGSWRATCRPIPSKLRS